MSKKELIFKSALFKVYPEKERVIKNREAAQTLLRGATAIAALGVTANAAGSKGIAVLMFATAIVLCIARLLHIPTYWATCSHFCHVATIYSKSPEELCKMSLAELQRDALDLLTVRAEHFLRLRGQVIEKINPRTTMEELVQVVGYCVAARERALERTFTVLKDMRLVSVTLDELYQMTEIKLQNSA